MEPATARYALTPVVANLHHESESGEFPFSAPPRIAVPAWGPYDLGGHHDGYHDTLCPAKSIASVFTLCDEGILQGDFHSSTIIVATLKNEGTMSALFSPAQVGQCHLRHRVVMAPMTRRRALDDHTPTDMMVEYYAQRAAVPGTLLISEATSVSPRSAALPNTPGLYTAEQIEAWKPITAAVHARGSYIFAQLWICGRAARAGAVKRGAEVVSASDIPLNAEAPVPRPLTEPEILQLIDDYRAASVSAIEAGFDGVEIHGANGYLVDQFTQDVSNRRTDAWGGSVENRARFGIEVARAIAGAIGADRVGYRVSPWSRHHSMRMEDPVPQFSYLVKQLRELKLAYLHVIEARVMGNADAEGRESINFLVDIWGRTSPVIVAGGYDGASAREAIEKVYTNADILVGFGRTFVSNPDLPHRIQHDLPLAKYNRDLFYEVLDPRGYTDYPSIWEPDGQHPVAAAGSGGNRPHKSAEATVGVGGELSQASPVISATAGVA